MQINKNNLMHPPRPLGTPQEGNKNKKNILLVAGFILIILVGLFGSAGKAWAAPACYTSNGILLPAQNTKPLCDTAGGDWKDLAVATNPGQIGTCTYTESTAEGDMPRTVNVTQAACKAPPYNSTNWSSTVAANTTTTPADQTAFQKYVSDYGCGLGVGSNTSLLPGCLISGSYYLFYAIPSGLLWISAYFFNVLISVTLSSKLLSAPFVATAWTVVRDLSNIFFILVLLYIAIQIILDLGHDAKKMIVRVIIMALLINFSMFFTQIVIDSSNILALVFYNKLNVCVNKDPNTGNCRPYDSVTGEKDVAGSMMDAFDPTKLLSADFFKTAGTINVQGVGPTQIPISYQMIILVTILAGLVMLFAAYAFFIAGISFMGRMIELFVLVVFSPFAFMSSTIPILGSMDYIGWDAWLKRLLKVAFMAAIFMFFMYFIFLLVSAKIFNSLVTQTGDSMLLRILSVIIPAGLILILLLKATEFAKKGSGALGDALLKGAKVVGGLALGGVIGGAAVVGRAGVGRAFSAAANSETAQRWEREGKFGAATLNKITGKIGNASFDARGVKIGGKTLSSATGMNLGEAQKGGFAERKKEAVEKRTKRAKELQVGENEKLKQDLNKTEMDLQGLLGNNAQEIETVDKLIEKKRQEAADANSRLNAAQKGTPQETLARTALDKANNEREDANRRKDALRGGDLYTDINGVNHDYATIGRTADGKNIDDLEKQKRIDAQAIKTENVKRNRQYAATSQTKGTRFLNYITSGGAYTEYAAREAAHSIVMETKA